MPKKLRAAAALIACAAIGAAVGCAGPDLTKQTFQRTTIPATAALPSASSPTGAAVSEPTDPAFSVDKLRALEPCKLFDKQTLATFGTPISDPLAGLDDCFSVLRDGQGNTLSISVDIGETVLSGVDSATRQLAGLPLSERKLPQSDACFETVITNKSPDLGITVQTGYSAGDPCRPGRAVLEQVVQRIRNNPPVRAKAAGSITPLDPCQLVSKQAAANLIEGEPEVSPYGLRMCTWRSGNNEASLQFALGADPAASLSGEPPKQVSLGGVTAYQNVTNYGSISCELVWAHLRIGEDYELVRAKFSGTSSDQAYACGQARQLAELVVPLLPKP